MLDCDGNRHAGIGEIMTEEDLETKLVTVLKGYTLQVGMVEFWVKAIFPIIKKYAEEYQQPTS